jgi:hypothetical protein
LQVALVVIANLAFFCIVLYAGGYNLRSSSTIDHLNTTAHTSAHSSNVTVDVDDVLVRLTSNACQLGFLGVRFPSLSGRGRDCTAFNVTQRAGAHNDTLVLEFGWRAEFNRCSLGVFFASGGKKHTLLSRSGVRSVLFHRSTPISFHIVVDDIATKLWVDWFRALAPPFVRVFMYPLSVAYDTLIADAQLPEVKTTASAEALFAFWCGSYPACPWTLAIAVPHLFITADEFAVLMASDIVYTADPLELVREFYAKDAATATPGAALFMAARAPIFEIFDMFKVTARGRLNKFHFPYLPADGGLSSASALHVGRMARTFSGTLTRLFARLGREHKRGAAAFKSYFGRKHKLADMTLLSMYAHFYPEALVRASCASFYDVFMLMHYNQVVEKPMCNVRPRGILHAGHGIRGNQLNLRLFRNNSLAEWAWQVFASFDTLPDRVLRQCPLYESNFGDLYKRGTTPGILSLDSTKQ